MMTKIKNWSPKKKAVVGAVGILGLFAAYKLASTLFWLGVLGGAGWFLYQQVIKPTLKK